MKFKGMLALAVSFVLFVGSAPAQQAASDGDIVLGLNGVSAGDVYEELKEKNKKLPGKRGVLVMSVSKLGPAEEAEISPGDLLTEINGEAFEDFEGFVKLLREQKPGVAVKVVGYSATSRGRNKPPKWKRGTIQVTPIKRSEMTLRSVVGNKDDISGNTVFRHVESKQPYLELYFIRNGGDQVLRWKFNFRAKDWIFMDKAVINAGGVNYEVPFSDVNREALGGSIHEWTDSPVKDEELKILKAIVENGEATIRFIGDTYKADEEVDAELAEQIGTVMSAFRLTK